MKNIIKITWLLFLTCTSAVNAQSVKKEYYDYAKTKVMEEYQVNSTGERHGWYKGYDQNGLVKVEASYKNGSLDGLRTEYATATGKRILAKTETYKDDLLNGPAKYYTGTLVVQQGEYVNGEKNGEWLDAFMYTNYDLTDEEKKGCDFVKRTITYDNGKVVDPKLESGELTETFYPSGKTRAKIPYSNGKKNGTAQYFFPTGGIEMEEGYDQGKLTYTLTNYPNGKLREYNGLKDGVETYEQYDENGNPTRNMENYKAQKERLVLEKEKERKRQIRDEKIAHADSILFASGLNDAQPYYDELDITTGWIKVFLKDREQFLKGEISVSDYRKKSSPLQLSENVVDYDSPESFKNYIKRTIEEDLKQFDEVNTQWQLIESAKKKYDQLYGPPSYSRSSTLFEKASLIIDPMMTNYKKETDFKSKLKLGETLLASYNKMNSYSDDECKEFKKSLKKIDDLTQIKSMLGL